MKTLTVPERAAFTPNVTTVFVVCAYHGDDGVLPLDFGFAKKIFKWPFSGVRRHYRQHVNFYANPRSLSYQLEVINEFRDVNGVKGSVDLLLDENLSESLPLDVANKFRQIQTAQLSSPEALAKSLLHDRDYGIAVLVFADAIGLGCQKIEDFLLPMGSVFVVNGRRRAFLLTRDYRRALKLRRFLTRWRFAELFLALFFIPISGFLALSDRYSKKGI